jgi:hypothetical protein
LRRPRGAGKGDLESYSAAKARRKRPIKQRKIEEKEFNYEQIISFNGNSADLGGCGSRSHVRGSVSTATVAALTADA